MTGPPPPQYPGPPYSNTAEPPLRAPAAVPRRGPPLWSPAMFPGVVPRRGPPVCAPVSNRRLTAARPRQQRRFDRRAQAGAAASSTTIRPLPTVFRPSSDPHHDPTSSYRLQTLFRPSPFPRPALILPLPALSRPKLGVAGLRARTRKLAGAGGWGGAHRSVVLPAVKASADMGRLASNTTSVESSPVFFYFCHCN
jgi:hypothetical protein